MEALKQGASVDKLIKMPVREAIGRFKYTHEDRLDEAFNEIMDKLAEEVAKYTGKGGLLICQRNIEQFRK